MSDGYDGWQGPGTGGAGYPTGPPGRAPRGSRDRFALVAGVLGSVLVVLAAVVVVLVFLDPGDDGPRRPRGLPTAPVAGRVAGPLAMPATIEARGPVARSALPTAVGELDATMGRTFTGVRTEVFGGGRTSETVLLTLATRRDTAPAIYVRDFVPAVPVTEDPAVPGPPGLLRCWSNPATAMCLWGDEQDLVYVSDGAGVAHARLVIANVYAGSAR
ncbi:MULTISPECIES: hypothetical protein [unclassified Embleya]|uniref:hypothetical protein n=1 Tax=unclassified Embleya TaxID=2699296 RepID=UPI0033E03394